MPRFRRLPRLPHFAHPLGVNPPRLVHDTPELQRIQRKALYVFLTGQRRVLFKVPNDQTPRNLGFSGMLVVSTNGELGSRSNDGTLINARIERTWKTASCVHLCPSILTTVP